LQALQQVYHLGFLLDVLDNLQDVQIRCTSSTYVDNDWTDERLLRKVLNLPWHGSREEQGLPLPLKVQTTGDEIYAQNMRKLEYPEEGHDVANVVFEPEIDHSIGFIHT
jgi:hypothetical protein